LGRVIQPLRSRCLLIRVPGPSEEDMMNVMDKIVVEEGVDIDEGKMRQIVSLNPGNMRGAILGLQTFKMNKV